MKIAGYISISMLLALGCAGGADKVKTEGRLLEDLAQREVFKPVYPELVEIYNEGRISEFYAALDTMIIMGRSGRIERLENVIDHEYNPYLYAPRSFKLEVSEDSAAVSILILDLYKCLKRIEFNQILPEGTHVYTCNFIELFRGLDSGLYFYLVTIGSKETLIKEIVLK
ncbi:MAG: hypothetical protein JSU85_01005 [Candidatus Zixiibacteriota bacterium]|nr:MAG: hypothetical protein JSU85_01005 [candidate division Zixibacteria bacterium]